MLLYIAQPYVMYGRILLFTNLSFANETFICEIVRVAHVTMGLKYGINVLSTFCSGEDL